MQTKLTFIELLDVPEAGFKCTARSANFSADTTETSKYGKA